MEAAAWFLVWSLAPAVTATFAGNKKNRDRSISGSMTKQIFGADREIDIPDECFPTQAELEEMEGEALLPGCEHGWYDSCTGVKLHYRKFLPKNNKKPKAIIIFMHGIQTHSGKAFLLKNDRKVNTALMAEAFLKEDIALYACDMYGHGYSEGTRFLIPDSWEKNLEDLLSFVTLVMAEQHDDSTPVFLMGESYGGTLTIVASKKFQEDPSSAPKNFKGLLLTGPAIIGDLPPYPVYFALRYILAPMFPRWTPFFMPNPLTPERIWKDPDVVALKKDKRQVEMGIDGSGLPFRLGTALNLVLALEAARSNAIPGFKAPYCIVHGTEDAGVPIVGSEFMWETTETPEADRAFFKVPGAYHDMLADPAAEESMDFFMDWIMKQLAK